METRGFVSSSRAGAAAFFATTATFAALYSPVFRFRLTAKLCAQRARLVRCKRRRACWSWGRGAGGGGAARRATTFPIWTGAFAARSSKWKKTSWYCGGAGARGAGTQREGLSAQGVGRRSGRGGK